MNLRTTIKRPSAFVPVAMSFAALAIVLVHIIMSGTAREGDEGSSASLAASDGCTDSDRCVFRDPLATAESMVCVASTGAASGRGARSTCASLFTQLITKLKPADAANHWPLRVPPVSGRITDRYSFEPVLVAGSLTPQAGVLLVLVLVRNTKCTEKVLFM